MLPEMETSIGEPFQRSVRELQGGRPVVCALLVTVNFCWLSDDLKPLLESYGQSLAAFPGYIDHVWMRDGEEVGIFHLFEDEAALDAYLDSGLISTLTAHPGCTGHAFARRFRVLPAAREEACLPESHIETATAAVAGTAGAAHTPVAV